MILFSNANLWQGVDFFGKIHVSYLFHKISLLNIFPIFSFMKKKEKWLRKMMINTLLSEVHLLSAGYYTYSWKHVTGIIFIPCWTVWCSIYGSLHDQSKCSMIVFHSVSLYFLETDLSIIEPLTLFTEKKESGSFPNS